MPDQLEEWEVKDERPDQDYGSELDKLLEGHDQEQVQEHSPRQERPRDEKEEKFEKEEEKQGEKEEKSWEEKWRRDPLNAAAWAIILIWAGLVLLANNLNLLDWIPFFDPLSILFLGAAAILFVEIALRLAMPTHRQPVILTVIVALVFLGIGLGSAVDWRCIWPLALIAVGAWLLYSGVFRRRE
jgi:hypothetical protein